MNEFSNPLSRLNDRSRAILRQLVESYLATGEPVGSRNLSRVLPMTLSPASIRNVMSDLEQLGLIFAPHTSAGRLPTQTGLRLFVDGLLEIGDISVEERRQIESQIGFRRDKTVDQVLSEAGIGPVAPWTGTLELVRRGDHVIAINHSDGEAEVEVAGHELLTDTPVGPRLVVPAGQTAVVRIG